MFQVIAQEVKVKTDSAWVHFVFLDKNTVGTINNIETTIELNYSDLSSSKIKGRAAVESLSTEGKMRDKHLKSDSYFNADQFPYMYFHGGKIFIENGNYFVSGELNIKGVKRLTTFQILEGSSKLVFKTAIFTSDFGIEPFKKREKNKVLVEVHVPVSNLQ